MKIPKLQASMSALVPGAQVLSTIPSDEVISIGCAKFYSLHFKSFSILTMKGYGSKLENLKEKT